MDLTLLWVLSVTNFIKEVTMSNSTIALATYDGCIYLYSVNSTLIKRDCLDYRFFGVDYCCNRFAFISSKRIVITDEKGNIINEIKIPWMYGMSVKLTQRGVLACYNYCAFYSWDGKLLWKVDVPDSSLGKIAYNGTFFVPTAVFAECIAKGVAPSHIAIIKDGRMIKDLVFNETLLGADSCNDTIAVGGTKLLLIKKGRVIELGKYKLIWDLAFSPDCKYIAVSDVNGLKIVDLKGNVIKEVKIKPTGVAWVNNLIAVGDAYGKLYLFKVTLDG